MLQLVAIVKGAFALGSYVAQLQQDPFDGEREVFVYRKVTPRALQNQARGSR